MTETIVKVYLVALPLIGLIEFFGLSLLRWYRRRRGESLEPGHKIFGRAFFHFVAGGVLLFLFTSGMLTSWVALILAAVLLIGFEYAMAISSKLLTAKGKRPDLDQSG